MGWYSEGEMNKYEEYTGRVYGSDEDIEYWKNYKAKYESEVAKTGVLSDTEEEESTETEVVEEPVEVLIEPHRLLKRVYRRRNNDDELKFFKEIDGLLAEEI